MALFMDQSLARRLERTEGFVGASFIDVQQRMAPEIGARWQDFDGTYAIFDGEDSPMTQTFGLGVFTPVTPEALSEIETFFQERRAHVAHEVCSLAPLDTTAMLVERGYRPVELGTVLVQEIDDQAGAPVSQTLRVRACEEADRATWVETSVAGWSDTPEVARIIEKLAELAFMNRSMVHFVVERDGAAMATASLGIHDGVALLAGASTIPSGRGLGAQSMLVGARLGEARRRGCRIAMMVANPGSTSQRNAERRGFRVAYTRTKWRREKRA